MKKKIPYILFCICAAVVLITGFLLVRYFLNAAITKSELEDLSSLKQVAEYDKSSLTSTSAISGSEPKTILKKYSKIYEKNHDMIGWIQVDDTRIDYPVMQTMDDNEFYLHKNFYKKPDDNGVPFLDIKCSIDNNNQNFVIYGHHMKSGMMFTDLMKYQDKGFFTSHKIINFDTLYDNSKYRIFGVFYIEINNGIASFNYNDYAGTLDETTFKNFVSKVKAMSVYNTEYTPKYGQDLITLITCSYHVKEGRLGVVAAKIEE